MQRADIAARRLINQHLIGEPFEAAQDVVRWQGAVQSQDFGGAKWALGLRMRHATERSVEQAFDDGAILRTHVLRPTWHFVAPADIRWMLMLTAPRVHVLNALQYRRVGLDAAAAKRCAKVFAQALQNHQYLTREALRPLIAKANVATDGEFNMAYILMHAELDGLICSGPRSGKQFTYALLEERVPPAPVLQRDEALAELVRRYFQSHGPATPHDFCWWSGLTLADARRGLAMLGKALEQADIDGKTYWFAPPLSPSLAPSLAPQPAPAKSAQPVAHLLPNYDEYGSYKDRSAILNSIASEPLVFSNIVVLDGRLVGTWRRTLTKASVQLQIDYTDTPSPVLQAAVVQAAERFGAFLGLPVDLV